MAVINLVSAVLLCACVFTIHTSAAKHHNKHQEKHNHHYHKVTHKLTHHDTHHHKKHKHVIKHKDRKDTTAKHHGLDKKSNIPEQKIAKKFDITPHPQKRPDMLTVVMQGREGKTGQQGPQGDMGAPGPPGLPGEMGSKGFPGVCSRNQCENEQLKSLIQRLLALEKFVNNIENSRKQAKKKACPNVTMIKVQGVTCAPNLFAIVPLIQLANRKPDQNAPQPVGGTAQGQTSSGGQNTKVNQGQTQPPQPTARSLTKPTQSPTGTAPPTASVQRGPVATPPPPPFFVTLQGVTTYDTPMAVLPQARGMPSYLRQPYKTIPANWVSSGKGPIDLKPGLSRNPQQKVFYSPRWSYKRNTIAQHGLLTHKLAAKMLHQKKQKKLVKKNKQFKDVHHTSIHTKSAHRKHA